MSLKLVRIASKYQEPIVEMLAEWTEYNVSNPSANSSPWAIFKNDYRDFKSYAERLEVEQPDAGMVPDSTFFCFDEDRGIMVGAVNIRHCLNEHLLAHGGHIGDGIRPSERGKGYGTQMIALALAECRALNIDRVLMVCDKSNLASAKTIQKNGGILENEIDTCGKTEQRYWITLA